MVHDFNGVKVKWMMFGPKLIVCDISNVCTFCFKIYFSLHNEDVLDGICTIMTQADMSNHSFGKSQIRKKDYNNLYM